MSSAPAEAAGAMASRRTVGYALAHPGLALHVAAALLRGFMYRIWYAALGRRVTIGRHFRVEGRLSIKGPGRVHIGDNVTIGMVVTPWTYSKDAVITIGDRCFVNGTRFSCAQEITIGPDGILAECHILDTNQHSTARNRRQPDATIRIRPVRIERNVWIAASAGILPGTTIGENSVVSFGAVCSGPYPADMIIVGNPAHAVRPVPEA